MKKLVSILFFLIIGIATNAQTAQFAWMAGSTFSNSVGPWGTKGVGSPTNAISSRENAHQWTDNSGNFWVFGGNGHASTFNLGRLSDMWKYDLALDEWTWVSGTTLMNQNGIYGTKLVASITNNPGGRSQGVTFLDNTGNLWLFGGLGNDASGNVGNLNDLWKFNKTTNEWTWVTGTNTVSAIGVYGTLGVGSTTNTPGARSRSVSWVDANGIFWLHGGYGFASTTTAGQLSDLWKFNPATLEWTWVSGTNVITSVGVYGTKGVPSTSNRPGGRGNASSFMDLSGNLWLFGGNGHATAATMAKLNDLWKFNPLTLEWTWVSGSNTLGAGSTYGVKGAPAAANVPSGRDESAFWTDNSGNFWLLGGHGKDVSNGFDNELNDLWMYHVTNNTWTYVAGSTAALQSGVYGTKGVLSSTNILGSRQRASSFKDSNGDLWLFAGYGKPSVGTGYLSDWWKIKTCYTSLASTTTPSTNLVICAGTTTSLSASGTGNLGWYSAVSGGTYLGSGNNYSTPTITSNTTYYVQDSTCGAGPRVAITVTVNALPTMTVSSVNAICNGATATMSVAGTPLSYTWNTGATTTSIAISPSVTTVYTVTGTDINGCVSSKTKTLTVNALPSLTVAGSDITICKGNASIVTVSGANTYTWNTGSTNASFIASPTVTTIYTVTGRNSTTGCTSVKVTTLTVQSPTVTIAGTFSICQGGSSTFTANGANTYTWSSSGISPVYTNTAVLYPNGTVYTLVGKDGLGCAMSQTFAITTLVKPTVSIVLPPQGCPGQTVIMTGSGASTYTWMPGNIIGNTAAVSPSINTTYTLYGTSANTCTNSAMSILTVKTPPSISITTSSFVSCSGANVNLYANGSTSNTYTWSTGATTNSTVVSPTATIVYSLSATGTNGCLGHAAITITVNPLPTLTVTGNNVLCAGNTTTLTASGANTYTWSAGFLVPTIGVTPLSSTNYSVIGKDANNCINTTTYSVTVNQLPTLNVTTTNAVLCTGETSTLSVIGAATYTWSDNSNGTDIIVSPTTTTNYSVTGVDANGCSNASVFSQSVSICTGIQQVSINSNSVLIFPNPNNGEFTIQSQIGDVVNITNELGQVIETIELNQQNNFSYQVNHLQSGIYFLVGKTIKQKVIVSK
jgi:N-acetylneuraminic acid mutarotase